MIVDFMLQFPIDEQVLKRFAYGTRVTPHDLAKLFDKAAIPMWKKHIAAVDNFEEQVGMMFQVLDAMQAGKDQKQKIQALMTLGSGFGNYRKFHPNGNAAHDGDMALLAAAEAAATGTNNGAAQAAQLLLPPAKAEGNQLRLRLAKGQSLADMLRRQPEQLLLPPPPKLKPVPLDSLEFGQDEWGHIRLPSLPQPNSTWARAEQALQDGEFETAEELWRQLLEEGINKAREGGALTKHSLPLKVIEMKLAAARARAVPVDPPHATSLEKETAYIDDATLEHVIARAKGNEGLKELTRVSPVEPAPLTTVAAGAAPAETTTAVPGRLPVPADSPSPAVPKPPLPEGVEELKGGSARRLLKVDDRYVYKELQTGDKLAPDSLRLQTAAEAEAVHAVMARMMGLPSPGLRVRFTQWNGNDPVKAVIVSRYIGGRLASDLKPEELYMMKAQMARHRVLAVLLGDYDRKPDNYKVTNIAALFSLDAGQGDPRGRIAESLGHLVDDPELMSGYLGLDHWWRNSFVQYTTDKEAKAPAFLDTIFFSETNLTYQDAAGAIAEARRVLSGDAKDLRDEMRRLYKELYGGSALERSKPGLIDDFVNETVYCMRDRLEKLDEAFRSLNRRNGVALPPALPKTIQVIPIGLPCIDFPLPFHDRYTLRLAA